MTLSTFLHKLGRFGDEPEPAVCSSCKSEVQWQWWDPPREDMPPRWMPPADPCPKCTKLADDKAKAEAVMDGLKRAGVPYRYRRYRWHWHLKQKRGEAFIDFRNRVEETNYPCVGITRANAEAAGVMRDWRPHTHKHWVYLHGPVGTGKTLFSAMLTRMLLGEPLRFEAVGRDDVSADVLKSVDAVNEKTGRARYNMPLRRVGGWQVRFVQEHTLQREMRSWWHRRKRDPTLEDPMGLAGRAQVLVLDDIGTADQNDGWKREMESLIDTRYANERPTVITGNLAYSDIERHYGSARLVSRLAEMVKGTEIAMDLTDWRKLAKHDPHPND